MLPYMAAVHFVLQSGGAVGDVSGVGGGDTVDTVTPLPGLAGAGVAGVVAATHSLVDVTSNPVRHTAQSPPRRKEADPQSVHSAVRPLLLQHTPPRHTLAAQSYPEVHAKPGPFVPKHRPYVHVPDAHPALLLHRPPFGFGVVVLVVTVVLLMVVVRTVHWPLDRLCVPVLQLAQAPMVLQLVHPRDCPLVPQQRPSRQTPLVHSRLPSVHTLPSDFLRMH